MPRLKGNASDTALKKIVQKINDYELSSGEIVSDLELSNELNISRTPVREAMQQLIDIGLLERTATKVVVRSITLTDIVEIFQIREAIEIMSVKIILSNGGLTEAQKLELMDIHQNLCNDISNGNFDKNFSDDTAFHEKLIEYSGNSRMEDISRRISLQSQRLRWLTLLTPSRYAGTRDEHERIIQGILNQDLDSTARAIQEHLQGSLENYTQILNNNQWMKIMSELKNMNP
ncbi:GntR family transcriptional regulator [Enterocloster sp. OA13]|uniref:GntR family transcriptional regulator n=1 Tax=Enterocloster hominis (ex Hitch et al. 2024) TaxID=1917870 RepID=A0ABV1DBE3_9FIRM|nr:GntR family transcriptional regulator [Lachnoclostridium pacaense]MCC2816142.1 GntR family transcriptional regulator [Lachnoclostridium pacaense]MCC2876749.1 GntR family transcriptional regulator [Lachnoclostridium pacaense]MCH1950382.1 GntR family transcriptional regulator [Enterocloster sp. OA13]